jgi:predicted DNA binding CopG/RHH family protein
LICRLYSGQAFKLIMTLKRISENDLSALQRRAAREGMPYQTLIGSVFHKYVSGFLKEAR